MKCCLVTSSDERCGIRTYGDNLMQAVPEVEWTVIGHREFSGNSQLSGYDLTVLNYEAGLFTGHLLGKFSHAQKKILILHTSHEGDNRSPLTQMFNRVVVHEHTSEGFTYIPHGMPEPLSEVELHEAEVMQSVGFKFALGSVGFPFPWKGFYEVSEAAQLMNSSALIIAPVSHHCDALAVAQKCRERAAFVATKWCAERDVIKMLACCSVVVFAYGGGNCAISGAVGLALASRRPVVVTRCRMFRDLIEDYSDEVGIAECQAPDLLYDAVVETLEQGKRPQRVIGRDELAGSRSAMVEAVRGGCMTSSVYKEITKCRLCNCTDLKLVLNLGVQKIADFVATPNAERKPAAPLELVLCQHCSLLQLRHTVSPDVLFSEFWYKSGVTGSMHSALKEVVATAIDHAHLKAGDCVLDIGANDGTLCSLYPDGVTTCGIDPSQQIMTTAALGRMSYAARAYFNKQTAEALTHKTGKKFKAITAIAMFYDLDDPVAFLRDVNAVLDDDGVFIVQMNYLATMVVNNAVDNIVHEHLAYYSLQSLEWVLVRMGFAIVDVDVNAVNGGSLRVVAKKAPARKDDYIAGAIDRIKSTLEGERQLALDKAETYYKFGAHVKQMLEQVSIYLTQQTLKGKRCYAYGASTRGSTLLQLQPFVLSGVAERDAAKVDLYMTASWLRIHDEHYVRTRADIMLVLPWHFKSEIVEREKAWLDMGGTLLFPLPKPVLVTKDGEREVTTEPLQMTSKMVAQA